MKVALAQLEATRMDKDANILKIEEVLANYPCDLAIFPEMFLTSYNIFDAVANMAEPLDGPSVLNISKLAEKYDTMIIFGMPELCTQNDGLVYNSAVLCHPNGKVDSYRKVQLANFGPFEEKLYYAIGRETPVFSTKFGKIGIQICYDLFFPELAKRSVLLGANLIVNISASPTFSKEMFEAMIPARAIENTVFFLYCNNLGTQKNLVFWGGNRVVGPRGDIKIMAEPYMDCVLTAELDMEELRTARQLRPTIANTVPELFSHPDAAITNDN